MKNNNSKGSKINIVFSSFLIIGYIICTYFFSSLASQVSGILGGLIQALMLIVFGLLLFYATRVGEGKQVKRFSLAVLLLIVVPSFYIVLAGLITGFPLHNLISPLTAASLVGGLGAPSIIFSMACVALGYGVPYTFFSGYEMKEEGEEEETAEDKPLEGGLAEELAETETEDNLDNTAEEEIEAVADSEETEIAAEETTAEAVVEEQIEQVEEPAEESEKTEE